MADRSELVADLPREYRLRFGERSEYRRKVWRTLIDAYFVRFVRSTDVVLDLACGWGEFIDQVAAAKRYAIDLNPDAAAHLDAGVELLSVDAAGPWPLADRSLDCVFTSNFLEHLPDKAALDSVLDAAGCLAGLRG